MFYFGNSSDGHARDSVAFSTDLIHWEQPNYVLTPDDSVEPGETQFYGMSGFVFRGDLIIGLAKVLHDDWQAPGAPAGAFGVGYTSLVWSRDGIHWTRDRAPFFEGDPEPNAWDHAHAWIDEQLIVGDEVFLYYGGYKQGHKMNRFSERQIGLVKMPLDRYVAREALPGKPGTLTTVPMKVGPRPIRLVVNADASAGELRIEIEDVQRGDVVPGLSFDDCQPIRVHLRLSAQEVNCASHVVHLAASLVE